MGRSRARDTDVDCPVGGPGGKPSVPPFALACFSRVRLFASDDSCLAPTMYAQAEAKEPAEPKQETLGGFFNFGAESLEEFFGITTKSRLVRYPTPHTRHFLRRRNSLRSEKSSSRL